MGNKINHNIANCPKCGAEFNHVKYGKIMIEHCPSCGGMFFDYEDLKHPEVVAFENMNEQRTRGDQAVLNELPAACPKCGVEMKKEKKSKRQGPTLDICPSCNGIWFDKGKLEWYRAKEKYSEKKAKMLRLKLVCRACDITLDADRLHDHQGIPQCPRCQQIIGFEGVGEACYTTPKSSIKKTAAALLFCFSFLVVTYLICQKIFDSDSEAGLATFVLGLPVAIIVTRALIFNKFALGMWSEDIPEDFDLS